MSSVIKRLSNPSSGVKRGAAGTTLVSGTKMVDTRGGVGGEVVGVKRGLGGAIEGTEGPGAFGTSGTRAGASMGLV